MNRSLVVFVAFGLLAGLLAVVGCDESDEIVVLETEIRQLELENTRLDVLSRNLEARILQLETTLETYLSGQLEESDSGELVEGIPYSIPKPDSSAGDGDGTVILPQEVLGFGTGQWRVGFDISPGVSTSEASDDGTRCSVNGRRDQTTPVIIRQLTTMAVFLCWMLPSTQRFLKVTSYLTHPVVSRGYGSTTKGLGCSSRRSFRRCLKLLTSVILLTLRTQSI